MSKEKKQPSHQVSFARVNGRDENGREVLGPARQIGAIWPREGKDGEGILRLDHVPEELRAQGGGVLFVRKIDALREQRTNGQSTDKEQGHER
ncbi:MAG TPA: hypothetical protein VE907_04395 [Gammaproteobacteria bacterium]|nr:hypothetical protein [Gammaproteobacteria bacterium]